MARNSDPRFIRVRSKLAHAVVNLAGTAPIDEITVSQLTKEAGISRTTFYKHGDSPAQFYADVLIEPLEPHLERLAEIMKSTDERFLLRWREVYVDLLGVIAERRTSYERLFLGEGHSSVIGHFTSKLTVYFGAYVSEFRERVQGPRLSDLWVEMAVAQQVYNFIAIVTAWLRTGMSDSADVVVNTYLSLAPPWQLARFTEDGTTSMRRTRLVTELATQGMATKR